MQNLNSILEGGGYKYGGIKYYSGEYQDRHFIRAGEVIVANTEQTFDYLLIGYPALVPQRYSQGLFSHHLFRVRPQGTSPLTSNYIYLMLLSSKLRQEVIGYANGTTVNMLPTEALQKPKIVLPPSNVVDVFERYVSSIFAKKQVLEAENDNLKVLRDTLLPKLLSGELRVPEAMRAVEEVGEG
jgi:type I restriction enzyme S subunit